MQPHGRASHTFRRWPSTTTGTPESTKASESATFCAMPVRLWQTACVDLQRERTYWSRPKTAIETSEARCAPLLADARDRSPLPPHVGPVQVVAPCDRTHARWVRAVTELTIVVAGTSAPAASERPTNRPAGSKTVFGKMRAAPSLRSGVRRGSRASTANRRSRWSRCASCCR